MNDPRRFHITLTSADRPAMHGWWGSETTARSKFTSWVGDWGVDQARIVLVDEATNTVLKEWPDLT